MNDALVLRVLATLSYSYQFKFPLSVAELRRRLITYNALEEVCRKRCSALPTQPVSICASNNKQILHALLVLMSKGIVSGVDGYYFPTGSSKRARDVVEARRQKELITSSLKKELAALLGFASRLSWIRAIGITGSAAVGGATQSDDIDLVVITTNHRLWLARSILLFFAIMQKKKKPPWSKGNDKWCFNLWLEESSLALPKHQRSLFGAIEAVQVSWLLDKAYYQQWFIQDNNWINQYVGGPSAVRVAQTKTEDGNKPLMQFSQRKLLIQLVNDLKLYFLLPLSLLLVFANYLQFLIAKKHLYQSRQIPSMNTQLSRAFLHDRISYQTVLRNFQNSYKQFAAKLP